MFKLVMVILILSTNAEIEFTVEGDHNSAQSCHSAAVQVAPIVEGIAKRNYGATLGVDYRISHRCERAV